MEKDNFNANVDFVRGQADIIVLSALADKDKYGLEILNSIQERSKGTYTLKQATLYNSLKRLEKSGYVTSYDGDVSNGAKRVYYGLTEEGRKHLNDDKSYWEFCNFLMSNLVSDTKFDPETEEKPFDPTEFRPLTRRNKPEQEKEKEVIIKYIEVVRTPEEMQQRQNTNSSQQYVLSDKPVEDGAILREVQSPEIVEANQTSFASSNSPVQNYADDNSTNQADIQQNAQINDVEGNNIQNDLISERNSEENIQSSDNVIAQNQSQEALQQDIVEEPEEYVQSTFIDVNGELSNDADSQYSAPQQTFETPSYTDTDTNTQSNVEQKESSLPNGTVQSYSQDNIVNNYPINQPVQNNQQPVYNNTDNYQHANINYQQEVQSQEKPSPLYQSNNYFDENNEVNYVSSFADLFKVEEEQPVQAAPEYDFMSMNEMVFKFQAKGITIKPYNKKNTMEFYVNRYYYSNKLHFHTALIMFFIIALELVVSHFICNRTNPISNYWLFSILFVAVYPIIRGVMYAIEPNKKSLANFNPKTTLLISLLPVITLPIVIALLGFVQFGANINDYSSMERTIILPCVLLFNIPFYFFVFALKYRTNKYHIN